MTLINNAAFKKEAIFSNVTRILKILQKNIEKNIKIGSFFNMET